MQRFKGIGGNILGFLFAIYIMVSLIITPYNNWEYAKNNGFVKWFLFGEVVATVKAFGWPYFVFKKYTNLNKNLRMDEKISKSIMGFFNAYVYFISTNKLAQEIPTSEDQLSDLEKVISLLNGAKERISECDLIQLNKIYNGWGDIVSNKFIPAIDLLLNGMNPNGDRNDCIRSDALIVDFNVWLQNNWNPLLLKLNKKYGFDIKR